MVIIFRLGILGLKMAHLDLLHFLHLSDALTASPVQNSTTWQLCTFDDCLLDEVAEEFAAVSACSDIPFFKNTCDGVQLLNPVDFDRCKNWNEKPHYLLDNLATMTEICSIVFVLLLRFK